MLNLLPASSAASYVSAVIVDFHCIVPRTLSHLFDLWTLTRWRAPELTEQPGFWRLEFV